MKRRPRRDTVRTASPSSTPGARRRLVRSGTPWTAEDDATLRRLWPDCVRETIQRALHRSWDAIRQRSYDLRLTGRWDGYVTLKKASLVTGVESRALRRIIEEYRARVIAALPIEQRKVRPIPTLTTRGDRHLTRWRHQLVEIDAARDAVTWWLTQETRVQAAARHGLPNSTLCTLLARHGVEIEHSGRRDPAWWDAWIAEHGPKVRLTRKRRRRRGSKGTRSARRS